MKSLRRFVDGPWRAVPVLGVTQILAWGTIFYTPVLIVPLIAADRGWSIAFTMGGFSFGLLVAGLVLPYVGRAVDLYGGHVVMTAGSLIGALGLFLIVHAAAPVAYFAVWMVLGVAMAASLYDSAFASLGRIFGAAARRPITALTLIGGFASTVSWPATHFLLQGVGWRGTYLIYAATLAAVAAPMHALALPRRRVEAATGARTHTEAAARVLPPHGLPFVLVASAFAFYAFVPSGMSANLLEIFARSGIDAGTVVWIGALFGPAQVGARMIEFAFGRNVHPLWVARFALSALLCAFVMLAIFGISTAPVAAADAAASAVSAVPFVPSMAPSTAPTAAVVTSAPMWDASETAARAADDTAPVASPLISALPRSEPMTAPFAALPTDRPIFDAACAVFVTVVAVVSTAVPPTSPTAPIAPFAAPTATSPIVPPVPAVSFTVVCTTSAIVPIAAVVISPLPLMTPMMPFFTRDPISRSSGMFVPPS